MTQLLIPDADKGTMLATGCNPMLSLNSLTLASVHPDAQLIRVRVPGIQYAEFPHILKSDRLGPAIAIGMYDPVSRGGLMAISRQFTASDLGQLRERVAELYDDTSKLKLDIFGAARACLTGVTRGTKSRLRRWVTQERFNLEVSMMAYFSKSQLEFHWLEDGCDGRMILNLGTGEFGHLPWHIAER